ncbi:DUF2332 domain-containing protein [Sphingomonas sp. LM7]|uniref:DUF2332 domain-containing protein n=1 Tax=Sphingomonas sp. LM7 TaxID=1938607 RepID=UPI000983D4A2|nr:DUF2332 family protein [Sphingomonas sp. LM7]AQR74250.1 hypothetical protein BXU08_11835 [Sphingomonas sp. LM7]
MTDNLAARGEFTRQADIARALGSPFVASVLEAGERHIRRAPRTAALIETWPGDPSAAALAMRFNAAIHALARRGRPLRLETLYKRQHDDFDGAIGAALDAEDDFIAHWMRQPTQTNEVNRAAAILSALMVANERFGLPFELLELGSSAGLNLNLARYGYDLGGVPAGTLGSTVQIAPTWHGAPPPEAAVDVLAALGVDLHPLDVADEATRDRLLSFVFADQPARAERLQNAIALAQRHPPRIARADAVSWLAEQLALPQDAGRCRAVFHSMVLQYLSDDDRKAATDLIAAAGARATPKRPLAWVSFEWTANRSEVQLWLTCWPSGEARHLATCHPYGAWIDWHG